MGWEGGMGRRRGEDVKDTKWFDDVSIDDVSIDVSIEMGIKI